jgi:hypothetical protein
VYQELIADFSAEDFDTLIDLLERLNGNLMRIGM